MTPAHTPGPWKASADARIEAAWDPSAGRFPILGEAFVAYRHIPGDVAMANARLMAAAPEMLDMLKKVAARPMSSDVLLDVREMLRKLEDAA